jgi:hypothetical protein
MSNRPRVVRSGYVSEMTRNRARTSTLASARRPVLASSVKETSRRLRALIIVALVFSLYGLSATLWISQSPSNAAVRKASVDSATTLRLESFDFSTPSTGLGVFTEESLSGNTCADFVGRTTNGGALFNDVVRVMSWNCSSVEFDSSVTTDGRGDVFLYGPQRFVSHNNSKTWSRDPQPGSVLDVDAVGPSVWAAESFCTPAEKTAATPCPVRLVESVNGGRTWEVSPTSPPGSETGMLVSTLGQSFLTRTNRSTAYFMLAPHFHSNGSPSVAPLWFTTNGGKTWSNRQVPCHMGAWLSVFSVAPDGTMMTVCASEPSVGEQPKTVLESSNGGKTWVLETGSNIENGSVGSIDLLSAEQAFLVGSRSSLLETNDGGSRWTAEEPLIGSSAGGTSEVRFFNDSHGLVLGNNDNDNERLTLWSTDDGGAHWKVVVPRVS